MESYAPLLEKIRIPQPSLQRLAVISIFQKIRSAPSSAAGINVLNLCLYSASPAVVDQSTRELCRLVKDSKFDLSTALLELHSALEGSSSPQSRCVFIKAIGFLIRFGFQEKPSSFRFHSSEVHPFVKILSCGTEVQCELVKQVVFFILKCKHLGMEAVCEFLGPFLNYSVIKIPVMGHSLAFARNLISTILALCCSFPQEAIPILNLLTERLKYFSCKKAEEVANISYVVECLVDAYLVVLRQLVGMGFLVPEAQLCGLALVEEILLLHKDFRKCSGSVEKIIDASRNLLSVQKELNLNYMAEYSSVMLSLSPILMQSELEHEQYPVLKLVLFLLRWKTEREDDMNAVTSELTEELLFIFPVLALVSSPSRCIKQIASELLSILGKMATALLIAPKKKQAGEWKHQSITTPGHLMFRFLRSMWLEDKSLSIGLVYVDLFSNRKVYTNEEHNKLKTWSSSVRAYCLGIIENHKQSAMIARFGEKFLTEIPFVLCAVASVLLLHQWGNSVIDLLDIGSSLEPKLSVPLLLAVLFYSHIFSSKDKDNDAHDMLLKLLGLLPSLASHSAMIPLVVQILAPMLDKDINPVIKATAIRMICKTWSINDRVFGTLHGVLHQNRLMQFASERSICISMAVSILDVCKQNPDRGVDLILSVEACIENHDHLIRSLGFQSLACLCEADVIDFYTAWDVIEVHAQNYLGNALVAHGLSLLLKWGAMDADAYPGAATNVLNILWNIVVYGEVCQSSLWTSAQEAAFAALLRYEVMHIQRSIPDFSHRNMELLISQANPELLAAVEAFEVKIINYEHITRQRFVKQRKASGNKIVKLLDVVPGVIFSSVSDRRVKELPGAALLVIPTSKDRTHQKDVHAVYEDAAVEIAASLQLSRNILLALFSLQSWKPFMLRWIRSGIMVLEAKAHIVPDKTLKAADYILKVITSLAEVASPQSAENMALALGAFCLVLPPSSQIIKSTASKFMLNWLSQYEHEHRQWSAAISLGLITSCLHVTDHKQKFENINALIEVASVSKSTLVKGACGTGLGFSCQDLLTGVDYESNALYHEKNTFNKQETELLRKILRSLVQMICQFTGSSAHIVEKLASYYPLETDDSTPAGTVEFLREDADILDLEDIWGIAGPVIGLGNSLGALYRAGAHDAVRYLKDLILSWIPGANFLSSKSAVSETGWQMPTLGACLALPSIVLFCQRVELINRVELVHLVNGFMELISELLSIELSDTFHQYLLMASCVGAGSLLSIILNAGVHSLELESVKGLLALFRRTYSSPHLPFIHLGGMLGVVNALGAGAGILIPHYHLPSLHTTFSQKESSYVSGPLLSNLVLEQELTTLIQEIFLVAQNSDDSRLQHYASWAVTFLSHSFSTEETSCQEIAAPNQSGVHKSIPQGIAENSLVMKLSLWLINVNYPELGTRINISTVACALRCLSHAPRLPSLDWGAVIRRCMKYSDQAAEVPSINLASRRTLREECFLFSLSHANQSDSLLGLLDELSDLPRLKTLESKLQSLVFLHLGALLKIFSSSRLVKLFDDLAAFIPWFVSSDQYTQAQKDSLKVLCWKGLYLCLNESALEGQDYAYTLEHFMEVMFEMLPGAYLTDTGLYHSNASAEWTEAIRCLGKARQSWLSNLLMVLDANFKENGDLRTLKKVQAKAALVQVGSVPLSELSKLKAIILDANSEVIWNILVEVAVTLQDTEENVRRQWLVDTTEILCVTSHPSTALRFLGLLCGSWCKYMPILVGDKVSVSSDLPITLSALLSGTGWEMAAESVASYICTSTERIHDWVAHIECADYSQIDRSENDSADVLLQVLHRTSISLKDYLPVEKQLRLANMDFT